ncbi:hypothetical protein EI94DRAFT_1789700 [Lactarius quietus]|nr:hypothetical protein EI94DRAFT_1789700 [Lactarius quietus]
MGDAMKLGLVTSAEKTSGKAQLWSLGGCQGSKDKRVMMNDDLMTRQRTTTRRRNRTQHERYIIEYNLVKVFLSPSSSKSTSTSSPHFRTIFIAAIKEYERKTKTDLHTHPLATQLQSCNSSSDILKVLHDKVNEFDKSRSHYERLSHWLNPTINVLYAFSATLGQGVGLIFSPANVISAGIGILFMAAKDVGASEEALANLFERIEGFFGRLESYTQVPPTSAMTDVIVNIMVEVLNIFGIATKEMKQGRASALL